MDRDELIKICEDAIVPVSRWRNRDSPAAQEQVGKCWALLKADCKFVILKSGDLVTDDFTIWIEIESPNFNSFENGAGPETQSFYLPTRCVLDERVDLDWY